MSHRDRQRTADSLAIKQSGNAVERRTRALNKFLGEYDRDEEQLNPLSYPSVHSWLGGLVVEFGHDGGSLCRI